MLQVAARKLISVLQIGNDAVERISSIIDKGALVNVNRARAEVGMRTNLGTRRVGVSSPIHPDRNQRRGSQHDHVLPFSLLVQSNLLSVYLKHLILLLLFLFLDRYYFDLAKVRGYPNHIEEERHHINP